MLLYLNVYTVSSLALLRYNAYLHNTISYEGLSIILLYRYIYTRYAMSEAIPVSARKKLSFRAFPLQVPLSGDGRL